VAVADLELKVVRCATLCAIVPWISCGPSSSVERLNKGEKVKGGPLFLELDYKPCRGANVPVASGTGEVGADPVGLHDPEADSFAHSDVKAAPQ